MNFYIYVYLDPTKKGQFSYNEICFLYEPFYIGKGKGKRSTSHLTEKRNRNPFKKNKILKIKNKGLLPFIEIINKDLHNDEAIQKEKYYINTIGRRDKDSGPLTNLTDGGEGTIGIIQKEHTKIKRVESLKKSTFYETVKSDEFRKKMSDIAKKRLSNPEFIQRLSDSKKGENNPMFGKKRSEESITKMKDSHKKLKSEGKMVLSEAGRLSIINYNKNKNGKKCSTIRNDSKTYLLFSPQLGETFLQGALKLQEFCKYNKLQVHTLKNNLNVVITESMIQGNKVFARNTIGCCLKFIQKEIS